MNEHDDCKPRYRPDVPAVEFEGYSEGMVLRAAAQWIETAGLLQILSLRWDDRVVYEGYKIEEPRYVLTIYYEK